jgi:hypothetical protein
MSIIGKIIKIFAIVFAICLIAGIILGITNVVDGIEYFTNDNNEENNTVINSNVGDNKLNLDIELAYSSLKIVTGEEYKIESNNEELKISEDENTIFIKDKKKLFNTKNRSVTIYLPDDREFNNINIEAGAGKIEIERLKGNNISFDLGAGLTVIDELYISNSADINTGAGSFTIKRGNINNLDLDMGVGDTLINSILKGNNKINSGIGKLEINLLDSIDNYTFDIDKGIGEIRINNKEVIDNYDNGTGQNKIYIDGGIGKVNITTVN